MSELNPKQGDKGSATPGADSPEQSGELDAAELDKVAGGMKPALGAVKRSVKIIGDPCDGGE